MKKEEKKRRLLNFLDEKAFDPIINKSKEDFGSDEKKKKFEDVKQSTESEKKRFHNYDSPEEIRNNYLSDVSSEAAEKINRELKDLNLPRLPDLKEDFLKLCDELEVKKS